VIEEKPDGRVIIHFGDWTPLMISLSTRLHRLPLRPDDADTMAFEVGIDRLHSMGSRGDRAMELLIENIDALEYRPNHAEVVALGEALIRVDIDLHTLRRVRLLRRRGIDRRCVERLVGLRHPDEMRGLLGRARDDERETVPPTRHLAVRRRAVAGRPNLASQLRRF